MHAPQPELPASTHRNVLVGRDGWLFLQNDTNDVMAQLTGRYPLPADFMDQWRCLFELRRQRLESLTGQYFFGVIPNKACVYSQHLPDDVVLQSRRPVHDIMDAGQGAIRHHYFLQDLIDYSHLHQTYCKGDTHWNHRGALCAFNSLMRKMRLPELTESELAFETRSIAGDLTGKIGQTTQTEHATIIEPKFNTVHDNGVSNVGRLVIMENENKNLPSLVLFRDSFGSAQMQMFASRFSRVVAVWQPNIDYEIVRRESPDFVISQQVERFLTSCPNDSSGPSNAEYVAMKRAKS